MSARIDTIDAIRGFALFGILIVNILAFSSVWYGAGLPAPGGAGLGDAMLAFTVSALFELKFYLLFSFLFGYSFTLQMQSAQKAEAAFLPRILRRQAGLFLIGALHAVLLFHGDILTTYAVLGCTLLALKPLSDRAKLWTAAALIVTTAAFWLALAAGQWVAPRGKDAARLAAGAEAALAAWRGGPAEIIAAHLAALEDFLPILLLLQAPCALAMFLAGFVAGQRTFFQHSALYRPHLGRAFRVGLAVGLPGGLLYAAATQAAPGTALETAGLALSILTAPFLTLALLAGLLALFDRDRVDGWRGLFAAAGRMALSNYLLQSVVSALIFHGYGLGLTDRLGMVQVLGLAVAIFAAQLLISRWWLARFRYGPLEWLLRAVTLWRRPEWKAA